MEKALRNYSISSAFIIANFVCSSLLKRLGVFNEGVKAYFLLYLANNDNKNPQFEDGSGADVVTYK